MDHAFLDINIRVATKIWLLNFETISRLFRIFFFFFSKLLEVKISRLLNFFSIFSRFFRQKIQDNFRIFHIQSICPSDYLPNTKVLLNIIVWFHTIPCCATISKTKSRLFQDYFQNQDNFRISGKSPTFSRLFVQFQDNFRFFRKFRIFRNFRFVAPLDIVKLLTVQLMATVCA